MPFIRLSIWSAGMAAVWMVLVDHISIESYLIGFVVSFGILALLEQLTDVDRHQRRLLNPLALLLYLINWLRQVIASDILVAMRILQGQSEAKSGIVKVPVGKKNETIGAMSAHAITSAPGSFVVDYVDDGEAMLIHLIDLDLTEQIEREQKERFEINKRILRHD